MASASPVSLPSVNLNQDFSVVVTVLPDSGDDPLVPSEIISSVSGVLTGLPTETIAVTAGVNSVTIAGKHQNTFVDVFTYTDKGESDLTQPPITAVGIGNMPDKKNLYDLIQDPRQSETRTYTLTVNESQTLTVTQVVQNPLEVKRSFMANYNYNDFKGG